MDKIYTIFLDGDKIGITKFENADPPMGVVFGKIDFLSITSPYSFMKNYCIKNKIDFEDYPADALISTRKIPNIQVFDNEGKEIKGVANSISGMDSDVFDIYIEGMERPFYEEEFPHHVKQYREKFGI